MLFTIPHQVNVLWSATFVLFWAVFTSAPHFYHLEPFLLVHHIINISSHFYECASFSLFWAIFTRAPHLYHFEPFLRVRHISTILSHFTSLWTTLLIFRAIFTSAPHFHYFEPFLRERHIFTILSHFYECAKWLGGLTNSTLKFMTSRTCGKSIDHIMFKYLRGNLFFFFKLGYILWNWNIFNNLKVFCYCFWM